MEDATERFALLYRLSNTANWKLWGVYPTIDKARAARKDIPRTMPSRDPAVSGRVLGTNIRAAHPWE